MGTATPLDVVTGFLQAMGSGDIAAARAAWADDAIWHVTGSHDVAGDYSPDEYLAMLGEWATRYPDYAADFKEFTSYGDTAVLHMESRGGMAPDTASGLLVYRVRGEKIAEGWAIPSFGDGRYAF
jgi:ketosteroid isomerase-like protein